MQGSSIGQPVKTSVRQNLCAEGTREGAAHRDATTRASCACRSKARSFGCWLIASRTLSDFYAPIRGRTPEGEFMLNGREHLAPCTYVFDQGALGPNVRRAWHRPPHDVGGDTMGCLEARLSAAVGPTMV